MRPVKACLQCRNGKRRCDPSPSSACSQCLQRNMACSADPTNRPTPQSPAVPQALPSVSQTRSSEEAIYLVDLYFQFIHDQPHSLFHKPTFKASVIDGTVSQTVLLSMLGLSARYKRRCTSSASKFDWRLGLLRSLTYGRVGRCMLLKPRPP